ncbi:MAG: efflux RND transporter permease subunit [Bdellovibrionota bacterium]
MRIIKFFLKHALPLNIVVVLLMVFAIYKAKNMQLEAFPSVDFDMVSIQTVYPGASPKEVEQYVTDLIEDEIENISGIDEISSTSIESFSIIVVKLDPDLSERKKDAAINDIQRAVDRVRDLPEEVTEPPLVKEIDSGDFPVVELSLYGDLSYKELHQVADELAEKIRLLPDAKETKKNGFRDKEYWVEVDPQNLRKNYMSLSAVAVGLAANNLTLPGGDLHTEDKDFLVRTIGQLNSTKDIDDLVLRTNGAGITVKVKDIGSTKETFKEENRYFRTNGQTSINLLVLKKSSGDIINLVDDVKKTVEKYKKTSPFRERLKTSLINDMSIFVERRLGVLLNNGVFGIILVLGSLLLFLSPGIALVAAVGMPVAFLGAVLVMSLAGMTINLITMFALVIVLGMLVDDAIIVAENIWQHYENGASPLEATVNGTSEVFWPVTATILTTIAAFSPLLMVSGIFGKFMASMPKVVIVALVISLIEAMIILPLHAYDIVKLHHARRKKLRVKGKLADEDLQEATEQVAGDNMPPKKGIAKLVFQVTELYGFFLHWTLKLRYLFLIIITVSLIASVYFAKNHMKFILFPTEGIEAFFIRGELPLGTTLDESSKRIIAFENVVKKYISKDELRDYVTIVGVHENDANDPLKARGSNLAQVGVYLRPESERQRTAQQIIDAIRGHIDEVAKEQGFIKTVFSVIRTGPPVGKPVAITIAGDDLVELAAVSEEIQSDLAGIEGVQDISQNFLPGKGEIQVDVDVAAASKALLSVRDIALHVRAMLEGEIATYVRNGGERTAVRVRYKESERKKVSAIRNSYLTNARGIRVRLDSVVKIQKTEGINAIIHKDGLRTITVTAGIDETVTTSTDINKKIIPRLKSVQNAHPNLIVKTGGEYEETNDSMRSLQIAFVVAFALIFLVLVAQFSSMTQPFVVMAAVPFGFIGVILAFYLHQIPLSFLGMIGMIGLSGVVVNDSIVLVDFINKARLKGMATMQACVISGKRRFRAVWLTSITTIFGLLPMVYGIGGSDDFLRPAAMALGYGLIFSTVLILFFVPALYLVRIDLINIAKFIFRPLLNVFGISMEKES